MRALAPGFTGLAIVVIVVAGSLPGASHPVGYPGTGAQECGGFAPAQTQCNDGPHVWTTHLEHNVFAATDYTGVLRSTLDPIPQVEPLNLVAPNRELLCAFENGTALSCVETGVDATADGLRRVVARFCDSFDLPESKDPLAIDEDQKGGEGGWLCQVRHR